MHARTGRQVEVRVLACVLVLRINICAFFFCFSNQDSLKPSVKYVRYN